MGFDTKIQQKIQAYKQANPKLKNLSDEQIVSILVKNGDIVLTEEQKRSLFYNNSKQKDNTGLQVEKTTKKANPEKTIYLQSGRKVVYSKLANGKIGLKYFGTDGTPIKPEHFKKVEGQISISADGTSYTIAKDGKKQTFKAKDPSQGAIDQNIAMLNNQEKALNKAKKEQGWIGKGWDLVKNKTGFGDSSDKAQKQIDKEKSLLLQIKKGKISKKDFKDITGVEYSKENLEKFKRGELSQASAKINGYKEGQDMATDIVGDMVSGIAAVGIYTAAIAAAPITVGASIAIGFAAAAATGAAIKVGVKALDTVGTDKKYTFEDCKHDAATGAFSGAIAPFTAGCGGAAGKAVATRWGIQAVKQVGKEVAEESANVGFKATLKTALTNPAGYEYVGGNLAKRGTTMAAEMATDGALGGAIDGGFRAGLDNDWDTSAMIDGAVEGGIGGAIMSPIIGGGFKAAGKAGQKLGSGKEYINNFAIKKVIENTSGYKNSNWVKTNIDKFIEDCQKPYYDFGSLADKIGDRVKHPDLPTHKMNVLTTFLSDSKLYDNPKVQEELSNCYHRIHDAESAKNLIDGFKFYLQHKEYHNNSNIQDNLAVILFNDRLPIEKKSKIFNLIANDSNLDETKQPFLNYNKTKLEHFINCNDKVDIDLAYKILHDTNDNNGTILHRILDPNDECYSEIITLYNKFKDNPEYDGILNNIISQYKKESKQILDIMLNDKDFPKEIMTDIIGCYNGAPVETKSFIEEICSQKDFPKEHIKPIIKATEGLFEGAWSRQGQITLTNFAKDLVKNSKIPIEQIPKIVDLVNTEKAISLTKDLCYNFEAKGLYTEQVVPIIKNGNLDITNIAKINKMLPKERVINFNDAELAVVSGAYNFLGKKDIHELSKPQKRTLLNLLLQNKKSAENGELAGIKDLIPFFPENTEEYTRTMKDLSRSMNLSFEKLDNKTIEEFNTNLINLSKVLKTNSSPENINLAITHEEFINNVNKILSGLTHKEALKVQSQFGFKIENGKLTGYPQCNAGARADVNELVSRYTTNNSVKIADNPELEKVLNNLIKICPEIMNQIDSSNQFSKTLSGIQNIAKRPEFNKLNAEDKTVLMLATLLNNVDKSINSRMDSAFDAYFISQKFNLSETAAQKLYSIVELSDAPERFMNTTKDATRKMIGVQELVGQQREDTFDLIATKLKEGNTFELAKLLYASQYEQGFTRNFDKILEDRILEIKANDFTLPQTPAETYNKLAQSQTITHNHTKYSVKVLNAKNIPNLYAFTHAPDAGYITGGSRDANFANFDFFKLANDDKIICTCYISNDHYGPVKQFHNGFIFEIDNSKQYVGYGIDIWSIGKNIPDIVIEYFRNRGLASAKNRGDKFEQRAYISEQLKSILYPEDTSFSGKIKKLADNLFSTKQQLSKPDLQYIQRLENIKTQLGNKPFTIKNIETIDPEFAQAYKTFLNSDKSILVDSYHNEVLVSNPKITAIFTSDIDNIPEEYLQKAQEENLPIIVFNSDNN